MSITLGNRHIFAAKSSALQLPILREEIRGRSKASEDRFVLQTSRDLVKEPFVLPKILEYLGDKNRVVRRLAPADHRETFGIVCACKLLGVEEVLEDLAGCLEMEHSVFSMLKGRLWMKLRSVVR